MLIIHLFAILKMNLFSNFPLHKKEQQKYLVTLINHIFQAWGGVENIFFLDKNFTFLK